MVKLLLKKLMNNRQVYLPKSWLLRKTEEHKLQEKKEKRNVVLKNLYHLFEGRERVLDAFESKKFPIRTIGSGYLDSKHSNLKVLTPKQMLQRLPIALAQIKAGSNSESLLNEIRQIVYSLYQSKEITKKLYNNIIKSIKV